MSFPVLLFAAIFTVVTVLAFAFTVRGLLGVNFSFARMMIAGVITFTSFTPIMNAMVDSEDLDGENYFPTVFFMSLTTAISLLAGMIFLVIAEALVPSNTLPGPLYMVRALKRWLKRSTRYLQIM